ncbi:MAG: methyltransferase domain-containing protein [Polyangia bacterium]
MTGARRIFSYNWPIYVGTWVASLVVLALAPWWMKVGAAVALAWSAGSLVVSHWVYDRSPLAAGTWVDPLLPARTEAWASIDAGLDAEVALAPPGRCIARLDIYDGSVVHAPSVRRARAMTPRSHVATAASALALPLPDASCDLIAVVFTAHEIRDRAHRERFFAELWRSLRPHGRVLLVEHVRDVANFAAFGPGYVHFQPRAEWLRLAALTKLDVVTETRVTPFVMALALEKRA